MQNYMLYQWSNTKSTHNTWHISNILFSYCTVSNYNFNPFESDFNEIFKKFLKSKGTLISNSYKKIIFFKILTMSSTCTLLYSSWSQWCR